MNVKISNFGETQNSRKIWAYYLTLIKTEKFQKRIKYLRKKFNIPVNGFKRGKMLPPTNWRPANSEIYIFFKKCGMLARDFNLLPADWGMTIEYYIFYNKPITPTILSGELCTLWDFVQDPENSWSRKSLSDFNSFYPLGIRISPYASQRDIVDYVQKNFNIIKMYQLQYVNKSNMIAKFRFKRNAERDDFIYKHKNKGVGWIADELAKRESFLDSGEISKIISIENKRRKVVQYT